MTDVAKEMLKTAKEILTAGDYPIGLKRDKEKVAYDELMAAIANEHVWNVDYKEWTRWLNDAFYKASDDYRAPQGLSELYYDLVGKYKVERIWDINSLNKQLRLIRKSYSKIVDRNSPFFPMKGWLDDYTEFLESWENYLVMRKEAKKYIVKGRKVDPNAPKKEVFQPSHLDSQARSLIEGTLKKIVDATEAKVAESVAKGYLEQVERFLDRHDGETYISKFFRGNTGYASFLLGFLEDTGPNPRSFGGVHTYELKSNAKQIAKARAEESVDSMMKQFVSKNVSKIGPVMQAKGGLEDIDIIDMGVSGPSVSANIRVRFNDGTSFVVRNKAVLRWGMRKSFYQFPTTFHDVVYPDGSKKKMVPEKSMNKDWAVSGR